MRHAAILTVFAILAVLGLEASLLAEAAPTSTGVLMPVKPVTTPTAPAKTSTVPAKAVTPTAPAKTPTAPAKKAPEVEIMGQYSGNFTRATGATDLAGAKVARLPAGGYTILLWWMEGDKAQKLRWEADAIEGKIEFGGDAGGIDITGSIVNKKLVAEVKGKYAGKFDLALEPCKSASNDQPPFEGAIALLARPDGPVAPSAAEWTNEAWKVGADGVMTPAEGSNATKKSFEGCRMHLEFLVPSEPTKEPKDRVTAGVFLLGRYEIRLTDSFGLDPAMDGCGAITGVRGPRTNGGFPPGQWQTLDVVFRSPKVEGGSLYKAGLITAVLNGDVKIHDVVKVDKATPGGLEGPPVESAPLVLQAHGPAIKFRNIWLKPLKETDLGGL
jgi:hypothetical protein